MSEKYTLQEFTDKVNSLNPNGPKYDPTKTESLREALRSKKATQGDIIAQAEQDIEAQRQEATTAPPVATGGEELIAQLDQLITWKASGALSEDEFAAAKSKLLSGS